REQGVRGELMEGVFVDVRSDRFAVLDRQKDMERADDRLLLERAVHGMPGMRRVDVLQHVHAPLPEVGNRLDEAVALMKRLMAAVLDHEIEARIELAEKGTDRFDRSLIDPRVLDPGRHRPRRLRWND